MRWPELVPDAVCKTPVKVIMTEGVNEDGSPRETTLFEGMCNYSEKARSVLDAEHRLVELGATVLINGDAAPGDESITGYVVINSGKPRRIYRSSRARNPDGTVNYTSLELI